MAFTRMLAILMLTGAAAFAQDWFGTWKLHSSTDPSEDAQKRPQTLVIGESGWLMARVNTDGTPSAMAVRSTDDECILIGLPARYTCSQMVDGDRSQFRLLESGKEIEALDAVVSADGKSIKVLAKRGSNEYESVWVRTPDRSSP